MHKAFDGFCVREFYTKESADLVGFEFGEPVQEGDLHMVSACHSLPQALSRANERIQCGFDCEIWTCDKYLNERDMLMGKEDCKDLV